MFCSPYVSSVCAVFIKSTDTDYSNANEDVALGECLTSLEGKTESKWSVRVIQASEIAPLVWPIVFSGVLGSAVRAFTDYKVERGVSLMVQIIRISDFST
jgi:hypothetical protein